MFRLSLQALPQTFRDVAAIHALRTRILNMPDTTLDTKQDNSITANQFEAARTIAVAVMRFQRECDGIDFHLVMSDHFSPEDYVNGVEIEQAIDILNAIDTGLFRQSETDPDIGSVGWLNAALDTREEDEDF